MKYKDIKKILQEETLSVMVDKLVRALKNIDIGDENLQTAERQFASDVYQLIQEHRRVIDKLGK